MQKSTIKNQFVIYLVLAVISFKYLNFVESSTTPKNDVTIDGQTTEWLPEDLTNSTDNGKWGISWNSTCIFVVYENLDVLVWNGSVELVLVFDLDPIITPTSGYGSLVTKPQPGVQHSLPFSGDLFIQISPGAAPFFYSNTTNDWVSYIAAAVVVQTSPGAAEIAIDFTNVTDAEFNFHQFYFLAYAQVGNSVMDITPLQGNENAAGSGNRTFNGYWGFMSIDGVEPTDPVHINTFSTLPGSDAYYTSPPSSGSFNWTGYWWGLPPGSFPTSNTVVYIPNNIRLHIDAPATVFGILNVGGNISVDTLAPLNIADGGLIVNNAQCCAANNMNLNLLGSATFRNGQITDLANVVANTGTVLFDQFTRIHGIFKIINANVIGSPNYQPGSVLKYSAGSTFLRNQEWNSTISQPKKVVIDVNTRLVLGANNGRLTPHTVQGDLVLYPGSILDLNATTFSMLSSINIEGDLQNNGSLFFSSDASSNVLIQGNYLHYGSLYRNGHNFICPNITWTKIDSYCYQDNGTVTAAASGGFPPISFLWSFPNGTADSGATLQGLVPGSYNLTFVESNADGCPTTLFTVSIGSAECVSPGPSDASSVDTTMIAIAIAVTAAGSLVVLGTIVFISRTMTKKKLAKEAADPVSLPLDDASLMTISVIKPRPANVSSVKDVGVSTEQNPRWRKTMEDEHLIIDKFGGEEKSGYFAVYDGHGGREIAEFVANRLHKNILMELENCYQINSNSNKHPTIAQALKTAYLNTDELIKNEDTRAGSTAVTAYVRVNDSGERWLYVANCGDARAVLCRNGVATRVSMDHKPTDESEAIRVKNDGGWIVQGKVAGMLAVTRAFGDMELKKWVTADPYITETQLKPTDTILVVACDGLWDVVDDQSCMDFIKPLYETDTAQEIADKLVKLAMDKGTRDNVSIIVVKL